MTSILMAILVFAALILVLCLPPFMALQMLLRRYPFAKPNHRTLYRLAIGFAGGALAFNLLISTFFAPRVVDTGLEDALSTSYLVALGLSWMCLWGAVGLAVLIRRRRSFAH